MAVFLATLPRAFHPQEGVWPLDLNGKWKLNIGKFSDYDFDKFSKRPKNVSLFLAPPSSCRWKGCSSPLRKTGATLAVRARCGWCEGPGKCMAFLKVQEHKRFFRRMVNSFAVSWGLDSWKMRQLWLHSIYCKLPQGFRKITECLVGKRLHLSYDLQQTNLSNFANIYIYMYIYFIYIFIYTSLYHNLQIFSLDSSGNQQSYNCKVLCLPVLRNYPQQVMQRVSFSLTALDVRMALPGVFGNSLSPSRKVIEMEDR